MRTVMVLNSKGGAGKTTIATNIAAYFASQGMVTALKDYDPQGSATDWLKSRPISRHPIYGITAFKTSFHATRAWQMRLPNNTERLVIDSPAGVDLPKLATVMRTVDKIVVPVIPSPIDIRASAMFIRDLFQFVKMYPTRAEIAVVASRVPRHSPTYFALQRVFSNLDIPIIAKIHESENYIQAAEHGIGMLEMDSPIVGGDKEDWQPLLYWIDEEAPKPAQKPPGMYAMQR
jgi:chromosome partitioning protein